MSEILCPSCGKAHKTKSQTCVFCGENLEEIMLDPKERKLPSDLGNDKPKKVKPVDAWEEQKKTALKFKEQEKTQERNDKFLEQLFCTNCGKLHESESETCEYCGYNMKEAIQRFKERKE